MEQYGDVFDIYDACPIDGKYKYIQNLNENAEQLLTNVELMDLITYSEKQSEKKTQRLLTQLY